jgi:predicted metalloprotease
MEEEKIRRILSFTGAEKAFIERFDIPSHAFTPLVLSLRYGGDWSYSAEDIETMAIMDKTTVYDDEKGVGYTREEIYLFVHPSIKEEAGTVHRLEKCGEEEMRLLVRRPYAVTVSCNRIIKVTVNPLSKEIRGEELLVHELSFEGSPAYAIAHELEHLERRRIKGENLWEFSFV